MKNYSFCILKKNNKVQIEECEENDNKNYIQIKFKRMVNENVKEYFFAKGVCDEYGIIEYYENMFWECKDEVIFFTENQYNIIDFCMIMKKFLKINLEVQKVNFNNINENKKNNKLMIKKVFVENKYNKIIEELNENKIYLSKKFNVWRKYFLFLLLWLFTS